MSRKPSLPSATQSPLSEDDEEALQAFCNEVACDEISLKSWKKIQKNLDLTVQIFVSQQELSEAAAYGLEKLVVFARTTTRLGDGGKTAMSREKVECRLTLRREDVCCQAIEIAGAGDVYEGPGRHIRGNLRVVVKLKV